MQVVKSFFDKYNIDDSRIAVGVSGGADSLALVLLLKECFPNSEIIGRSLCGWAELGMMHHLLTPAQACHPPFLWWFVAS